MTTTALEHPAFVLPAAARLNGVSISPILATLGRVAELKRAGRDIVDLTAGEPDFHTPDHAISAAIEAMRRGDTKYGPLHGLGGLRQAIQRKFLRENDLSYAVDEIIVSTGAKQVIHNAIMASIDPGDEVIIPSPYWTSYPDIVQLAGGHAVFAQTFASDGYKLTADGLTRAITLRTRWLIINSPCNPTGAVYGTRDLEQLAEVLRRAKHVAILSDDIYEHIRFTSGRFATLCAVAPDLRDRCLIVNGVSKAYAMTGWRVGYGAGSSVLLRRMATVQSQSTSGASTVSQAAAAAALDGPQTDVVQAATAYLERRGIVVSAISRMPRVRLVPPDGAFYALVDVSEVLMARYGTLDDEALARDLLERHGVGVIPGLAFGAPGSLRISFAASAAQIEAGLQRLAQGLIC
jgi:aspartate aminotransferase